MKFRLFILLLTVSLFASVNNANAAFIVKKSQRTEAAKGPNAERASTKSERANNLRVLSNLALHQGDHEKDTKKSDTSGWEGIVALVCGILGVFTGILAIPAIIFGAIGMKRGKQHRGLARAGFILGVVVVGIVLLFLMIAALSGIGWA